MSFRSKVVIARIARVRTPLRRSKQALPFGRANRFASSSNRDNVGSVRELLRRLHDADLRPPLLLGALAAALVLEALDRPRRSQRRLPLVLDELERYN